MASWSPHGRQNASQDGPKTPKKVMFFFFFQVFGAKCPQVRPRTPKTTQFGTKRAPKTSPDLLWTWISIQFWTISYEILKDFRHPLLPFVLLCFALLCAALLDQQPITRTIKTMPPHANHIFETMFLYRHGGG